MSTLSQMDHVDHAFFAVDTAEMPQTIAAVCMLDGVPNWKEVSGRVADAVGQLPRLRQKVVYKPRLGWIEDDNFELSEHLETRQVPSTGTTNCDASTSDDLRAEAGRVISQRLDMTHAPWRVVLLTSGGDRACLVICLHHGSADGIRALRFLELITTDSEFEESVTDVSESCSSALPKKGGQAPTCCGLKSDMHNMLEPVPVFWAKPCSSETDPVPEPERKSRLSRLRHALACSGKLLREGLVSCSSSPINGQTSCQRSITPIDLPRQRLTQVMQSQRASLHDVIHAVVAGGVQALHDARGVSAKGLRVVVPMAMPAESDKGGLGNHLVLSTLTLPLSEQDPIARLTRVRDAFEQMKASGTIAAYEFAAWAISRFVPRRLHWPVWKTMVRKTNCVCTILPGPHRPRFLAGARITDIYGIPAPVLNHGAAFSFVTYAGKVCGTITTDNNVLPNGTELADSIAASLLQFAPSQTHDSEAEPPPTAPTKSVLDQFHAAPADARRDTLEAHLAELVTEVLGGSTKPIRPRDGLFDVGIDSMMAIDLHLRIQDSLQRKLPRTLILDYPTIGALADYLYEELGGKTLSVADAPPERVATSAATDAPQIVQAELEDLSEDQLAELLLEELNS